MGQVLTKAVWSTAFEDSLVLFVVMAGGTPSMLRSSVDSLDIQ